MSFHRVSSLLFLLLASLSFSCRGCRAPRAASITTIVGEDAELVLLVPSLKEAVEGGAAFLTGLTRKSGADLLAQVRAGWRQQLALDPLDVVSYDAWGIDTRASLAVFTEGREGAPLLALTVKDAAKLDAALTAWLTKADGASEVTRETVGAYTLQVAGKTFGDEVAPVMMWAHVDGFVVVARAKDRAALQAALQRLSAAREQKDPPSLARDAVFAELVAKVPPARPLLFARGGAAEKLGEAGAMVRGTVTSFALDGKGFASDTFIGLSHPGLLKLGEFPAARALFSRIDTDAVFSAASQALRADTLEALRADASIAAIIARGLEAAHKASGLDLEREVLPRLTGEVTLSVHLVDAAGLVEQLRQRIELDKLLDVLHVVVTAKVADRDGAEALLARMKEELAGRGLRLAARKHDVAGRSATIYELLGGGGKIRAKVGLAVIDDLFVYAAGKDRLERTLEVIAAKRPNLGTAPGAVASELLAKPGMHVAVLRLAEIARLLAQPSSRGAPSLEGLFASVSAVVGTLGDVGVGVKAERDGLYLLVREKLE